jgi:hypothetical protein
MKNIKDELQHIILGDEQVGGTSQLKKTQTFLRRHAETGSSAQKQERFKGEEAAELINFAHREKLFQAGRLVATGRKERLTAAGLSVSGPQTNRLAGAGGGLIPPIYFSPSHQ